MRPIALAITVALATVAATALAQAPATRAPVALSADECAVWQRELGFARSVAEHDAEAFAAHVHEGAVFGPRGPKPQRGRVAVAEGWAPLVEGRTLRLEWYPTTVVIGGEPDIAYSTGPALYEDLRPGAEPRYRLSRFQSIWHRGDDGVWRVLFDDGLSPESADADAVAAFRAGRRQACPQG